MRSNCADHAVSGYGSSLSSMSRIASAELIQVVLDAQQLQRVLAVAVGEVGLQDAAGRRSAGSCTTHQSTTAASVMTSPTSNPVVGDDRRTREGYHAAMRFRRLACALLAAVLASADSPVAATRCQRSSTSRRFASWWSVRASRPQRLMERVRSGADFAALARTESIDPSAVDGGLLGRIAISTLRPDLQTAPSRTQRRSDDSDCAGADRFCLHSS